MAKESSSQTYEPLLNGAEEEIGVVEIFSNARSRQWSRRVFVPIIVSLVIYNAIVTWLWLSNKQQCGPSFLQTLYSPAADVLELEIVKFHQGVGRNLTIYEGAPSPEVDAAWEDLFEMGISKIPKHQATLLTNKTLPIIGDEDNYIITLDVFHQLHCLNIIRKALRPDYYPPMNEFDSERFSHVGHCVDTIRQSLMCSSDISTIVYQWDEQVQHVKVRADIPHTCRKFDRIRDWAIDHRLWSTFNLTAHVKDDIKIAEF